MVCFFCWCYWFVFCVSLYIVCRCYWFVFCVGLYIICRCYWFVFFVSACTFSVYDTGFIFCVGLYIIYWCNWLYFVWACTFSVSVTCLFFVSVCTFSVYDTGFIFCVGLYLLGGNLPALVLVQDVDIAASGQTHSGCVGTRYVYDGDIWVVQIWHLSQLTLFFRSSRVT